MKVVNFTPDLKEKFDEFVIKCDDSWLFHLSDTLNMLEESRGFLQKSFAVVEDGKIIGMLPLLLKRKNYLILKRKYLTSAFGPAGPLLDNTLAPEKKAELLRLMFATLNSIAKNENAEFFEMTLLPILNQDLHFLIKKEHFPKAKLYREQAQTYIIDLSKPIEKIFTNFEKGCKWAIKKAMREGIAIERANSIEDIYTYYKLHKQTYKRTGVNPHPFEYFEKIWSLLGKKEHSIFFKAAYKGKTIGFLNMAVFKKTCTYWTGCSNSTALKLCANNLLQWIAIQFAKDKGYKWYNFGEAFPNARSGKKKGLNDFKKSFGGRQEPFHKYFVLYKPLQHRFFTLIRKLI